MTGSYHNHTQWSDGTATLEQMVEGARRAGLDELGVSDHYTVMPDGAPVRWAMQPALLEAYAADVRAAGERSAHPAVRLGIEADFLPETVGEVREALARLPLDYVIGSVHFVDGFPLDSSARDWAPLSQAQVDDVWRIYWARVAEMAESGAFDFVGHLDLPKKFGFYPSIDLAAEEARALDAIGAAGMAIEINTSGWNKPAAEAYPSLRRLRAARDRGIPLLINADAHTPDHVARHFERARALAREAGYAELVRYERRERFAVPL